MKSENSGKSDKLVFITGNAGKAEYLSKFFHFPVDHLKLDLPEIQSLDLRTIVEDKAEKAFDKIRKPVLVEDVSLVFRGLKKLPGPLIKWFLETLGNRGLCRLLENCRDRSAVAEVNFGFCDGSGVKIFSGLVRGRVAEAPRGSAGFGWDPIFIPKSHQKTWAEMTAEEKHRTSMRRIALEKIKKFLSERFSIYGE
jgi:non-canonical purine NTP pyrophosphatase (RdgB/HAM1 family)